MCKSAYYLKNYLYLFDYKIINDKSDMKFE